PSGCATGAPAVNSVVGGTCAGWPKPSWQSVFGNPSDGVRDVPDVALFASDGFGLWLHSYIFCWSDPKQKGTAPCTGAPDPFGQLYGGTSTWGAVGGTSVAAPIWAGIQALINQKAGGKQGLPNYRLYALANSEYGASGTSTCNSDSASGVSSSCIFYDIQLGGTDQPCIAQQNGTLVNCYIPSGEKVGPAGAAIGVLSTSNSAYQPAFTQQPGWDFATGIGTPNVYNLVMNWSGGGGGTKLADIHNTHDFNGDGYSDIAWRDTSGDVTIWLMNGTSILNPTATYVTTLSTAWSIVGQRDFNGDGKADLLWHDTSGDVAIWEMNGTTILNPTTTYVGTVSSSTWTIVGTGDFNGDGYTDILWRDTSGDVAIWLMNGTTVLNPTTSYVATVSTTWSIVETGDFYGTGMSDILWHDTSGDTAIWEMNGTTILNPTTSYVATVSPAWSVQGI